MGDVHGTTLDDSRWGRTTDISPIHLLPGQPIALAQPVSTLESEDAHDWTVYVSRSTNVGGLFELVVEYGSGGAQLTDVYQLQDVANFTLHYVSSLPPRIYARCVEAILAVPEPDPVTVVIAPGRQSKAKFQSQYTAANATLLVPRPVLVIPVPLGAERCAFHVWQSTVTVYSADASAFDLMPNIAHGPRVQVSAPSFFTPVNPGGVENGTTWYSVPNNSEYPLPPGALEWLFVPSADMAAGDVYIVIAHWEVNR